MGSPGPVPSTLCAEYYILQLKLKLHPLSGPVTLSAASPYFSRYYPLTYFSPLPVFTQLVSSCSHFQWFMFLTAVECNNLDFKTVEFSKLFGLSGAVQLCIIDHQIPRALP